MKNYTLKSGTILSLLLFFVVANSFAQHSEISQIPVDNQSKFAMVGYATANYFSKGGDGGFMSSTFNPIFVYKPTDKLSFNAELEIVVEDPEAWDGSLALEFAELAYQLNNNMTFYAGKFLSPIGTYQERYHPAWINKSINGPIAIMNEVNGIKRLQGDSELGMGLKGGFYAANARLNYNVYVTNGPKVNDDGSVDWNNVGPDNNNSPAIGGRIGILPFSNSTFELGLSGYRGKAGDKSAYSNVNVTLFAFDLNYVKQTDYGKFGLKGQYNGQYLSDGTFPETKIAFESFNNNTSASYLQLAYRFPSSKFELVNRIANFNVPNQVTWGADQTRFTTGIDYWLSWNTVFKLGVDFANNDSTGIGFTFAMGL
jgi:hypothetical protein